MKAVVMAGGLGTRLYPLTTSVNKHLLAVYDRPMIQRNIELIVASGLREILVLMNHAYAQPIMEILEHGEKFGANILYGYQREVTSVGKHLETARSFVDNASFLLLLGDSFYTSPLNLAGIHAPHMWVMRLGKDDDIRKYAEVKLSSDGSRVVDMTQKPTVKKSGVIQTGAWIFPPDVFDLANRLVCATQEEVQIRTICAEYIREGRMTATMLPAKSFLDLGTPEALFQGNLRARAQSVNKKK